MSELTSPKNYINWRFLGLKKYRKIPRRIVSKKYLLLSDRNGIDSNSKKKNKKSEIL